MVDMSPHVSAVFKELFEEIKSAKQQQWTITNYGLLILAAIYAVKLSGVPHSQTYLKILAGATAVLGSSFLLCAQYNMVGTRGRLDNVHNKFFTSNELEAIGWVETSLQTLEAQVGILVQGPGVLLFLLFLSCWAAQSSCVLPCSYRHNNQISVVPGLLKG
jgi:hypothetical protein